jgi:hypothetical protein
VSVNETEFVASLLRQARESLARSQQVVEQAFWQGRIDALVWWNEFNLARRGAG